MTNVIGKQGTTRSRNPLLRRNDIVGYLFLAPFFIVFFIFVLLPVLAALALSFTSYDMVNKPFLIGLTNFRLLFMDDDVFLLALKNTFVFAFVSGPVGFIASFIMAWLINGLKARHAFSLAFYAPSLTSGVALSTVWLYFFSPDRYGLINNTLMSMGVISDPAPWTLDPRYMLGVVMIVSIWMSMGAGFLTFLAGFQNISQEMYEAGMIDGIKNRYQELIYLTIPQMKPQLLFGAINAAVGAFGVFDVSVAVTGMPSPNYAAHTIVAHLYDYAFLRFEMGYASAVAIILFLITYFLGRIFMRVFKSNDI